MGTFEADGRKRVNEMSSMVVRYGGCSALVLASGMIAGAAGAQEASNAPSASSAHAKEAPSAPPSGAHESLQLSLQGSLLDYQKQTATAEMPAGSSANPAEQKSSSTSFGLLGSGFGVGIGYAWGPVLLGARAQFASTKVSPAGGGEEQASTIALVPRLEYQFDQGWARSFIAALFAVQHSSSSRGSANTNAGFQQIENSSTRFGMGAAFGIHAFLNQAVSLDPELSVLYAEGSGTAKGSGGSSTPVSQDYSLSNIRVLLTLGLSGWIDTGGAPTPPPPRPQAAEPAASPAVVAAPVRVDEPSTPASTDTMPTPPPASEAPSTPLKDSGAGASPQGT